VLKLLKLDIRIIALYLMSMKYPIQICSLFMFLLARITLCQEPPASAKTATAAVTTNDYALPELGTLHLAVPKAWQDSFKKTIVSGTRVDEFRFQPRDGSDFNVLISAVHMFPASAAQFDPRDVLQEAAAKELPGAVEKVADIRNLTGPEVKGCYFSLTDAKASASAPKPGEYKYLTLGYAKLGTLVLNLRVVSNRASGDEKAAVLEMIRSARLTPDPQ
jgi:hypothetical protein